MKEGPKDVAAEKRLAQGIPDGQRTHAFRVVFYAFFSVVYWLFCTAYLFQYEEPVKRALRDTSTKFLKSGVFWEFQRDVLLSAVGYFGLLGALRVALFK